MIPAAEDPTSIFETRRLRFRRFTPGDLEPLWAIYADPEVVRYIPDAPRSLEETQREMAWHMGGPPGHPRLGLWAAVLKDTGELAGRCGLLPWTIDGRAEVEAAYLIRRGLWGQGLGREAAQSLVDYGFGVLGLPRLVCLIDAGNRASIRVAEAIGMAFEKEGRDEIGPFLLYARSAPGRA